MRYILQNDLSVQPRLAGLFFIIDGDIYIDATREFIKHNSHEQLFNTIIAQHPKLKKKYVFYSYLYFPRGAVIRDDLNGKVLFGGPNSFDNDGCQKILFSFNYEHNDIVKLQNMDDEHYNLDWILKRIERNNHWDKDMIEDEKNVVKTNFLNQIYLFTKHVGD